MALDNLTVININQSSVPGRGSVPSFSILLYNNIIVLCRASPSSKRHVFISCLMHASNHIIVFVFIVPGRFSLPASSSASIYFRNSHHHLESDTAQPIHDCLAFNVMFSLPKCAPNCLSLSLRLPAPDLPVCLFDRSLSLSLYLPPLSLFLSLSVSLSLISSSSLPPSLSIYLSVSAFLSLISPSVSPISLSRSPSLSPYS